MKRRVRGRSRRKISNSTIPFSLSRVGLTAVYVLVTSIIWALRQSAINGGTFFPNWLESILIFGFLGILMLLSRTLFVIFGLAGIGYLLRDSLGYSLSSTGAVFWVLGAVTSFLVSLSLMAGYVAPPINQDVSSSSFMNFRLLLSYAMRELFRPKPFNVIPKNLPSSFETIGAGRLESHQAVTVHKGTNYVGAMGPGYIMLAENQRITDVIDLRPRLATEPVFANTRDLVNFGTEVTVMYSVQRPETTATNSRVPYSYAKEAIRNIHYANVTYQKEHKVQAFQRVGARAARIAEEQISKRPFDDLYRVNERAHQPLAKVAQEVSDRLAQDFKADGISILSVSFGALNLPDEVTETRINQWKSNWDTSIKSTRLGKGIREIDPDTAEIQGKVVRELIANVRTMADASGVPQNHPLRKRLEDVIYDIATEGFVRTMIPASKDGKK